MSSIGRSWTASRIAAVVFLTIGTTGWVVPGYLAVSFHMTAVEHALAGATDQHSFPFFSESQRMLRVTAIWLFAALFAWAILGAWRLFRPTRSGSAT